jgi:hypothetical protein
VRQLFTGVSDILDISNVFMEIAHTDDGVQLVARCREADGDGGAGRLFIGSVCSLGSSLPLLVVVGGHCEMWMRVLVALSQSTDNLLERQLFAKATQTSPVSGPGWSHAGRRDRASAEPLP